MAPRFYEREEHGVPRRWIEMVRHTLQTLGPKVLASRMIRDYAEGYYLPAAESLRRTVAVDGEGQAAFDPACELAAYRRRAFEERPHIQITDVDSTGLPAAPILGSKLTLTATAQLACLRPEEVTVQALVGRVETGDVLVDPVTVEMPYTGTASIGDHIFYDDATIGRRLSWLHRARAVASSDAGRGGRTGIGHAGLRRLSTE